MLRNEREMDSWQSRSKLKKTKIGWKRLKPQQKIPDDMVRPKMERSRAYVTPARGELFHHIYTRGEAELMGVLL